MPQYAAIFDMDGVLVDSYRPHFISWQRLAESHGLSITESEFAATFGQTSREILAEMWPDHVSQTDIPEWDSQKEAFYREELKSHFPEMAGASTLLQSLDAAGWNLAIGSSGPRENVEIVLQCLKAGRLFNAAVNGHDVTHGKPAPDVFLAAADRLGVAPDRCIVIEDAPVGISAAHAAHMPAAALTGTATRDQLSAAELIVDSLSELTPDILKQLIDAN